MRPAPGVPERWRVGTAGWSIPTSQGSRFTSGGSHLERYARVLRCVEINSSFYREHRSVTYARWAVTVPPDFRFAVKAPRELTHLRRLSGAAVPLKHFISGIHSLGRKLGPVLVQLPPSLRFDMRRADAFFRTLRHLHRGAVACEPRHPSWFAADVEELLRRHRVSRVAADPAPVPAAAEPGGWARLAYYRLHGSPRMYYSAYTSDFLEQLAQAIRARARRATVWCIFDNTAAGDAIGNALTLLEMVGRSHA